MVRRFESIALVGATGNVGTHILAALREAEPAFKSIVVLTRSATPTNGNTSNVHVHIVDYSSQESLVAALTGIDAVVSAVATQALDSQKAILDAALAANVKFFIPSEFGLASNDPRLNRDFPIFEPKLQFQNYLATLRNEGKIDYTLIFTGLFLDWGMSGFLLDVKNRKLELWDGGERPISMTSMPSIGKAVVGVLQEKVRGKTEVRIKDINISQRHLFELATEVVGKEGWDVTNLDTAHATAIAREKLDDGTAGLNDIYSFVKRAVTSEEYGMPWSADQDDSETLGLKPWTEKDVMDIVHKLVSLK